MATASLRFLQFIAWSLNIFCWSLLTFLFFDLFVQQEFVLLKEFDSFGCNEAFVLVFDDVKFLETHRVLLFILLLFSGCYSPEEGINSDWSFQSLLLSFLIIRIWLTLLLLFLFLFVFGFLIHAHDLIHLLFESEFELVLKFQSGHCPKNITFLIDRTANLIGFQKLSVGIWKSVNSHWLHWL